MRRYAMVVVLALATAARADGGDELRPVPVTAIAGKPYTGLGEPAEIEFINVRRQPVRLYWIGFDGTPRLYGTLSPGAEYRQPTFVSHRWLVCRDGSDAPIAAFIATRADVHADGQPQLAIIR